MKRKDLLVLDETDDKAVKIFRDLGMPKNLARTLMYIYQVDECRSADVEKAVNLPQPEICVAMQEMRRRGWVKKRNLNKKGKGRPVHIYTPIKNLSEIMNIFEQEKLKEVESIKNDLSELKSLIKNK